MLIALLMNRDVLAAGLVWLLVARTLVDAGFLVGLLTETPQTADRLIACAWLR